ncbi:MAG: hypothetical protein IRZ19_07830 [Pyrinomonas methylaliphatogenes]|nr:hypothetical protein [Pyrinomonas methylaliphatogenes]
MILTSLGESYRLKIARIALHVVEPEHKRRFVVHKSLYGFARLELGRAKGARRFAAPERAKK